MGVPNRGADITNSLKYFNYIHPFRIAYLRYSIINIRFGYGFAFFATQMRFELDSCNFREKNNSRY